MRRALRARGRSRLSRRPSTRRTLRSLVGPRLGWDSWDWDFSPPADFAAWTDFVGSYTDCTTGGASCRYRVVDSDAVGNSFTVTATPQGRTKLTGRLVAGAPTSVTVRVGHVWLS